MSDIAWWLLLTPPETLWALVLGWHAVAGAVAVWAYRRGRARERQAHWRQWSRPYF